jgi:hypothetical protein
MASATQALVIGNGAYPGRLHLDNPPRDAAAVINAFKDLGVDVTEVIDKPYENLLASIDDFIAIANQPHIQTSILYYSGHGIQEEEINYIVPIDFEDPNDSGKKRFISIQSVIDKMIQATSVKIVLLDACRTGKRERQTIAEGTRAIEVDRDFKLNGIKVEIQGLAEIKAKGDTFIAFAAGPGQVARDSIDGSPLSPFTRALVKYLPSVDLPLSNLTGRIRQEVLDETGQEQRTWDQSSLRYPFYFNPGSLLLFVGNLMALVGLMISTVIYSLVLTSPKLNSGWVVAALALPVVSFLILMFGTQTVYGRLRGTNFEPEAPSVGKGVKDTLIKGVTGGFLGSVGCSLFLSVPYYLEWLRVGTPSESFGQLYLEITYATIFAACVLGALTLTGALLAMVWPAEASKLDAKARVLGGASLGGVLTGLIVAPLLTWWFGMIYDRPEMKPWLLLPGSIVGSSLLIFSIVNFDLERLSLHRAGTSAWASICALIAGAPVAFAVFAPLYWVGIGDAVTTYLEANAENPIGLMKGGAVYGAPVGLVLGLVIGFAIILTQRWSGKPVLG